MYILIQKSLPKYTNDIPSPVQTTSSHHPILIYEICMGHSNKINMVLHITLLFWYVLCVSHIVFPLR